VAALIKSRVPPYWKHDGLGFQLVRNRFMQTQLQQWIRDAIFPGHRQCDGVPVPSRAAVTKVLRVENGGLWQLFQTKKEVLKHEHAEWRRCGHTPPSLGCKTKQPCLPSVELSAELNELFLFHGTSHATAMTIAQHGFDERVAALKGLYGAGSYFADSSCKANQYAAKHATAQGQHVLLLCRVLMGWAFATSSQHGDERRPPTNPAVPNRPFDSIFAESGVARAGKQEHHEFVVFDRNQIYPEYVIYYTV
jgi:hypothetical protein